MKFVTVLCEIQGSPIVWRLIIDLGIGEFWAVWFQVPYNQVTSYKDLGNSKDIVYIGKSSKSGIKSRYDVILHCIQCVTHNATQ